MEAQPDGAVTIPALMFAEWWEPDGSQWTCAVRATVDGKELNCSVASDAATMHRFLLGCDEIMARTRRSVVLRMLDYIHFPPEARGEDPWVAEISQKVSDAEARVRRDLFELDMDFNVPWPAPVKP